MSENMDDLLGDEQTQQQSGGELRRQLEEALRREKEYKQKLDSIEQAEREAALSQKVSDMQLDLDVVKALNPGIGDLDAQAQGAWLTKFAEARGVPAPKEPEQPIRQPAESPVPEGMTPEDVAQLESIQAHTPTSEAAAPSEAHAKLNSLQSEDDFWAFIQSQGGGQA